MVVITGASSGNGRAAAHAFAMEGAHLVLAARRLEVLRQVAAECRRLGGDAIAVETDVGSAASVAALAATAVDAFGRVDVWVNNAAVLHFGRLDETPPEIVEQVVRTNVIGYLNGAREAVRIFRRDGQGVLINVSSILSAVGHPYTAAYVASKFAVRGLTSSLRAELLREPGIHVCAVLPAAVDTPIYQRAANFTGHQVQPIRVVHDPAQVGRAVVRLTKRPRREMLVGWSAPLAVYGSALAPALGERAVRWAADGMEIARAPAAPWSGNLFEPVEDSCRVTGGWRERYGVKARGIFAGIALVAGLGLLAGAAAARRRRPAGEISGSGMRPTAA